MKSTKTDHLVRQRPLLEAYRATCSSDQQAALDQAKKVFFVESTRAMLADHFAHRDTLPAEVWETDLLLKNLDGPVWIDLLAPVASITPLLFQGILLLPDQYEEASDVLVYLVNSAAKEIFHLRYLSPYGWKPTTYDLCPFGLCHIEPWEQFPAIAGVQICEPCRLLGLEVGAWITLALRLRAQYFAEECFEVKKLTISRKLPRLHSKKSRSTSVNYLFRVIDASIRHISLFNPSDELKRIEQTGDSWLQQRLATDPESVEYVPRSIIEMKRHYQHSRFVNLCGQTKTYRYEQPKIRLIPVVKENEAKRAEKVVASAYEEASRREPG